MEKQKITKKEIVREIGKDISKSVRGGLKGIGKLAVKASYPVLGNLSYNIQEKLEEKFGCEVYDANDAFEVSQGSNLVGYTMAGGFGIKTALVNLGIDQSTAMVWGIFAGLFSVAYWFDESKIRDILARETHYGACASVSGKIISLPIDAGFYVVKKVGDYFQKVKGRLESKKSLEDKINGGGE